MFNEVYPPGNDHISHLGKSKIISTSALVGDMLVPWSCSTSWLFSSSCHDPYKCNKEICTNKTLLQIAPLFIVQSIYIIFLAVHIQIIPLSFHFIPPTSSQLDLYWGSLIHPPVHYYPKRWFKYIYPTNYVSLECLGQETNTQNPLSKKWISKKNPGCLRHLNKKTMPRQSPITNPKNPPFPLVLVV